MDKNFLVESYRTSLAVSFHEDERRASIFKLFIWTQVATFAIYAWIEPRNADFSSAILYLSAAVNVVFFFLLQRMRAFIVLRQFHMATIEDQIPELQTFSIEYIFRKQKYVKIGKREFQLGVLQRISASRMEELMPIFVAVFWIVVAIKLHR